MANINAPRGLEPLVSPYGAIQTTEYRVYNSCAVNLFVGDPVVRNASGVIDIATAGNGNAILGAVVSIFDSTGKPVTYYPAGADNYTATVADDPQQMFVLQEDGDTSDLALTDEGYGCSLIAGSGSTTTGLSGWQLDSSTAAAASSQMRILRQFKGPNNAIGDYCRWVCRIDYHQGNSEVAGALV